MAEMNKSTSGKSAAGKTKGGSAVRRSPLPKLASPVSRKVGGAAESGAPEAQRRRLPLDNDNGSAVTGPENLDKVRDILFGSQMRDQDRRFARLEERMAKELSDLREENRARLDSLETYVKKEVQSLVERLKAEAAARSDAFKAAATELKTTAKTISDQVKATDERGSDAHRKLRDEALAQTKTLRDEIAKAVQEAHAATQRTADELRSEKADRAALGDLFTEIGLRLAGETPTPVKRK